MAVTELPEVLAAPFTAWVAPVVGTAFPAVNTEESAFVTGPTGWTKIGTSGTFNYSEAGLTMTHTQTVAHFLSAGGTIPRKVWRTDEGMQVSFELADLSPTQYALIMDNATVTTVTGTAAAQVFQVKRGITVKAYSMLLRGPSTLNEAKNGQIEISTCYQVANPAPKLALKGGPALLALTWEAVELEVGKFVAIRMGS